MYGQHVFCFQDLKDAEGIERFLPAVVAVQIYQGAGIGILST